MRKSRNVVIAVLSSRAILEPLFLTPGLFVDEPSEGGRVLSGLEHLRKAC